MRRRWHMNGFHTWSWPLCKNLIICSCRKCSENSVYIVLSKKQKSWNIGRKKPFSFMWLWTLLHVGSNPAIGWFWLQIWHQRMFSPHLSLLYMKWIHLKPKFRWDPNEHWRWQGWEALLFDIAHGSPLSHKTLSRGWWWFQHLFTVETCFLHYIYVIVSSL